MSDINRCGKILLDETDLNAESIYAAYVETDGQWVRFKETVNGHLKWIPASLVIMVERIDPSEYERVTGNPSKSPINGNDGYETDPQERGKLVTDGGMHEEIDTIQCQWCNEHVPTDEIMAVKPRNHAVMMCSNCMPEPPRDTDDRYYGLDQMKQRAERYEDQELYRNTEFKNQVL